MKIELFYFDGCPSYIQARENLKTALSLQQITDEVELIHVADAGGAQAMRFIGSPTIRIDGIDVEGPDADAHGYAYGCRVYAGDSGTVGWPSVEQIRQALQARTPGLNHDTGHSPL